MTELDVLRKLVNESDRIVFFGGAGTSTESGIPDFRSSSGLFRTQSGGAYAPEEILSRDFFAAHTDEFYRYYKANLIYPDAKPHRGHKALAALEAQGKLKAVITQNIDGLHQLAGSRNVLELHGTVQRNYCMSCRQMYGLDIVLNSGDTIPSCRSCGGVIKPDVVLYQESLDQAVLQQAAEYIGLADVLIVAGTSLTVQPAAGLVRLYRGNKLILINKGSTPMDGFANFLIPHGFADVMANLVDEV